MNKFVNSYTQIVCTLFVLVTSICLIQCRNNDKGLECTSSDDCSYDQYCDFSTYLCVTRDGGGVVDADSGADALDGGELHDGSDEMEVSDRGCPEPHDQEKYCILTGGYECFYTMSYCRGGEWICTDGDEHPPPMPEFEDWEWRCGLKWCNTWNIPDGPGDDWQEAGPYTPPDPDTLSGQWNMVAYCNSIVLPQCEKQRRQYSDANCFVVDPINPDVIYVGFDLGISYSTRSLSGVFKSVDGGKTWFEARAKLGSAGCYDLPCQYGPAVCRLYIDPDDPQVLFASTEERGLYRTGDGARTWEFVDLPYYCAWMGSVGKGPNGTYHTACQDAYFQSYDGGVTWDEKSFCLGNFGRWIGAFGFDDRFPERVWAGMSQSLQVIPGEGYLFLSDDGGNTWTELGREMDEKCMGRGAVRSFAICDADPNQMAVAVNWCGLFLSNDGGLSWRHASEPVDDIMSISAKYAPIPGACRLYANDGGLGRLWFTEDGGFTWTEEFQKPLDWLFFNPFAPEVITGLLVKSDWLDYSFELWRKE